MKKIISLILLAAVLLTLCACQPGKEQAKNAEGFCVGYSKVCIDPEEAVPLAGYGNHQFRYCTDIIDSIYATAVAVSDGQGNTVLLINTDMITTVANIAEMAQSLISEQTGIPGEQIIITSNHSHSVPDPSMSQEEASARYQQLLIQRISQAGVEAVADLQPATVSYGSAETVSMNFKRHYYMKDDVTGEISTVGDNFGSSTGKTMVGHTAEADPTIYVVKFDREGDNDVLLCNWRAHPHFTGGSAVYDLSSDFVGPFRDALEVKTGANVVYFQGAAGNVTEKSRINSENLTNSNYQAYGNMLADYAVQALENMTETEPGAVKFLQSEFKGQINHAEDSRFVQAKEVQVVWSTTADKTQTMAIATPYGIRSPYHANAIVANYSRTDEKDGVMTFNAVQITPELAIITFPGEAFDTIGTRVEEASPYDVTLFFGYAYHHIGYLPDEQTWEYTSYETDITRFVRGTDGQVVQFYLGMLDTISKQ